jgi:hypothetical protein
MARTAHQRGLQVRHRRRLQPRSDLAGGIHEGGGHVVVEHHVVARGDHPEQSAAQHLDPPPPRCPRGADEHRLALEDRVAEDRQALAAQGRPGLDDVGDDVGDAQGDGRLDRTVEAHDLSLMPWSARCFSTSPG